MDLNLPQRPGVFLSQWLIDPEANTDRDDGLGEVR